MFFRVFPCNLNQFSLIVEETKDSNVVVVRGIMPNHDLGMHASTNVHNTAWMAMPWNGGVQTPVLTTYDSLDIYIEGFSELFVKGHAGRFFGEDPFMVHGHAVLRHTTKNGGIVDADMGHLSGTSFALYGAETLTEFEGTCELIFKRNYKAILADVLQKRATYEELVQGLESRGVNIEFTKLTGEVNAVMYHEGIAGTEERIEGACAMYNRFGKFTDSFGSSGVIVETE